MLTKLWVPDNNGKIAFATPLFGPDEYQNVGKEILLKNLKVPTGDYAASLLHQVYCNLPQVSDASEYVNIQNLMNKYNLWVFNLNIWTCDGVYVIQDIDAKGRDLDTPLSELEKMILKKNGAKEIRGVMFSENERVRFAPKGEYRIGYHTPASLVKDGFVIASCNITGAGKLGQVSCNFDDNPYVGGFEVREHEKPEKYVSAIRMKPALNGSEYSLSINGFFIEFTEDECISFGLF